MRSDYAHRLSTSHINKVVVISVFILMAAAVSLPFYSPQSSTVPADRHMQSKSIQVDAAAIARAKFVKPLTTNRMARSLPVPQTSVSIATYASDCTTPKTLFNLQDPDLTVCAKVTGFDPNRELIWSNARFVAVQNVSVTGSNSFTNSFTLTSSSSLGDWRVILFEPFGGGVEAVTSFTVIDAANPVADLVVSKAPVNTPVNAGGQSVFGIQVTNLGPSAAASVQLTDDVPANTTFESFAQLDGPVFSCNNPTAGQTGTTTCTVASLERGETATFIATYDVNAGTSADTEISNTAVVSSTVTDSNTDNNTLTGTSIVEAVPCSVSCPSNITVPADSGQAGAIVTYSTPTGTGDCGQAISCNFPSGSFFPVGTTTVVCSGDTGQACTFQVTVENPGGLSISLNGASNLTIECGQRFADPGATAVDASGQPVAVQVTVPSGFNPDAPAVGTYSITYTATEDTNSVSTTRTVNVTDTEAPLITVNGANPYRIIQGSCSPFVDPGASALDGCTGTQPVTSSISGPGGLTSVDTNVAGTYTVTYTATDGSHTATATRTVLVGQFSQDESDQPASSSPPPTITLNGDQQIFIECGTPFTDPGATATVCGTAVQVTSTGTVDIHTPGDYSITYSATANGQTTTATRVVTVTPDNTPPVISLNGANPINVECHTGTFTDPGAVAHDACAGDFAATASGTVNVDVVGTYTITYTATDPSGFSATPVTRTVNVVDTTAPVVSAPANVTVFTGSGATSCGAVVSDAALGTASATDSCYGSIAVTRTGVPAGNAFPVGQTTITYSATDPSHNTGTATQIVTVVDNTPPIISCPASITLEPTCPSGAIATYTTPVGTDNCAGATTALTTGLASGSVFPIGTTTVTYTVTDASGNVASCSFQVTVKTPQQTIQDMIAETQSLQPPLTGTQVQGLNSKLQAALDAINQGKTNVACNKLSDFISQVQAYINNGTLTSAQGTPLITSANHVRNTIGCTNDPCS